MTSGSAKNSPSQILQYSGVHRENIILLKQRTIKYISEHTPTKYTIYD